MAENLGTGVSYVFDPTGYAYDTVVFQKGKPPMDTEMNLVQDIQRELNSRQLGYLPSGWMTTRPFHTDTLLSNEFYTQNPENAAAEYALVNGMVVKVTGTNTQIPNTNLIQLGSAPTTGSRVSGVFFEVWRALLDPNSSQNKPDPITVIDGIQDVAAIDANHAFAVGENGHVLATTNGGSTWNVQLSGTSYQLNGTSFVSGTIGWAVGNNGTVIRTSSGGLTWSSLSQNITHNLYGIHAISQLQAWVVGASGTILKTVNGVTFVAQSSGVITDLRGVYFKDNLVGWAVGDNGVILKTTNGGSSWIKITSGVSSRLNAVFFYDLQTGFIAGDSGVILRTSDGGASWVSQSANMWDGMTYSTLTNDMKDITMSPSLDEYVDGEEVSGQFNGTNKNCTVMNVPVTRGDGMGTTTNNPADITVTVNDVAVTVDSLIGSSGQIILHDAPRHCDTVKVYYWHKISSGIFRGYVWAVGTGGKIIRTDNLGSQWITQTSNTAYDLQGVEFVDRYKGWVVGALSTIRHTIDSGDTWTIQQSNAVARVIQRVYQEGNNNTQTYLDENSIHPDANVETTKRVQIQYRIRTVDADPTNYPEAGLGSSSVVSLGPNTSGVYPYVNMGSSTGDYGLWQAQCANTVDGLAWAIPMFFVARRNQATYNPVTNGNGQSVPSSGVYRADLLTAAQVVDKDILDVRRKIILPSTEQMQAESFDALSNNALRTVLARDTIGGDKYGTELLQLDQIGNVTGTPGTVINTTLADVVNGISSQVTDSVYTETELPVTLPVPAVPSPHTITASSGIFHQNPAYFSVTYVSTNPAVNGKNVPGEVSGLGTNVLVFTYSPYTKTTADDAGLASGGYKFSVRQISTPSASLSRIPNRPELVKNLSGPALAFYYNGVTEGSTKVIEKWDSGITGYANYAVAYPATSASDSGQRTRASTVEMHYFTRLSASDISSAGLKCKFLARFQPTAGASYAMQTISKINNLDAGFSYKMKDQVPDAIPVSTSITIEVLPGYQFLAGTLVEVIGYVRSSVGATGIRNGATVNFIPENKGLELFCASGDASGTMPAVPSLTATLTLAQSGSIWGAPTAETAMGLNQPVCWFNNMDGTYHMVPVTVSGFDTTTLTMTFMDGTARHDGPVYAQVMYKQSKLIYNDAVTDGLLIGYDKVPNQSVAALPDTLSVVIQTRPDLVYISDVGTGGGFGGVPYGNPIQHIPLNDANIANDDVFYNVDPLSFRNFSVDTGFVQMPTMIPAKIGEILTFSGVSLDRDSRGYYNTCSRDVVLQSEGLTDPVNRKVYVSFVAKVQSASDGKFLPGEYVQVVMSRNVFLNNENWTGWRAGYNCAIAVYRMTSKPITKV